MKKVILVDDEKAGRQLIKEYLQGFPEFILLAEANNGVDAVREINRFKPDLVFLDVQMPGMTGFEVLTHLEEIPKIIFSTAYDKYALSAFEVHAVDYLLKPYTQERFATAIAKLEKGNEPMASLTDKLLMDQPSYPERVLVQKQNKLVTVAVSEIDWIEAYGDYSKLHSGDETFLSNYGISALEEKMNPKQFVRVHRSSIINLSSVQELKKYGKSYDIRMRNGERVRVSRGYLDRIRELIL
ncbi:LytR/AlgR family response regulator transcription factor [Robiginitalea sp. IMCC43444]|uniref:LytR/AlgR family response regulator transcription factor n=1 Tax=Robiginitalea sp. IMCC43444 TaxID=3459121 RepID=UPI004041A216